MSCLPGTPCYDAYYHPIQNCGCYNNCTIDSTSVTYTGPNLPNTGVQNGDNLTDALSKVDAAFDVSIFLAKIANSPTLTAQFCALVNNCLP